MKNWGIKTKVLFLALTPAVLMALVLASYFAVAHFAEMDWELRARGLGLAHQIAIASAHGVERQDRKMLNQLVDTALQEPNVASVAVFDTQGSVLAAGNAGSSLKQSANRSGGSLVVESKIFARRESEPDTLPALPLRENPESGTAQAVLGKVMIEMSHQSLSARHGRELLVLAVLGLLCLGGALILARRMSREVTTPIAKLTHAMEELGRGNLDVRVAEDSGGELAILERGINTMADRLKESQQSLQRRIAEATLSLTQQKEEAERASLAKSRFLAAASHDLRQPMHALTLFVTSLKERIQYPEVSRIVQNIEASVNAMMGLFNALLDISRLDAGVLHANPEVFPIKNLLDRIRVEFTPHALQKDIKFQVIDSSLLVRSDPVLLDRIVMNLASNAIRYTARGGVVVGCRRQRNMVRIEVWDTGPGIPKERQREIFQEFFQLGNPERDRSKGLGLGLAIVERMAKLLAAKVKLRSVVGRGSVFSVAVPRAQPEVELQERRERDRVEARSLAGTLVAVIDDEAPILEGMQGLLQGWGCEVVTAGSGAEALRKLVAERRCADLIISDYRLREDENGIEVIRNIRARFDRDIAAILVTGDMDPDRLREAQQSGFHLIHKPVRPAKLRALMSYLIARNNAAAA